jgi:phage/plasmid-like protein (TIGR03299 family)
MIEHADLTSRADGTVELAYRAADGKPWHGFGNLIPENATVEQVQKAAGLDWTLKRSPVKFSTGSLEDGTLDIGTVFDRVVLYRSDTLAPLSVVSAKYQEVQPKTAVEFFRDMTEAGGYEIETAGTLAGGRRLWCLVKTGEGFSLPGGDDVVQRLLLATACDGSMGTMVGDTSIRVVCRNTFNIAIRGRRFVTVRHSTKFQPDKVKAQLKKVSASFAAYAATAETLARVQINAAEAEWMMKAILPPSRGVKPVEETRAYKTIMGLFRGVGMGAELSSSAGTAWGLLNAVTQYADHEVSARSDETRLMSSWFGSGANLKQRAMDVIAA